MKPTWKKNYEAQMRKSHKDIDVDGFIADVKQQVEINGYCEFWEHIPVEIRRLYNPENRCSKEFISYRIKIKEGLWNMLRDSDFIMLQDDDEVDSCNIIWKNEDVRLEYIAGYRAKERYEKLKLEEKKTLEAKLKKEREDKIEELSEKYFQEMMEK